MKSNDLTNGQDNGNKSLFESDRKLRTLVGNLPGVVYRCYNDKNWTMDFISKGCYDLTGYTQQQFYTPKRVHWGEIIHEDDKENVWKKIQKALTENRQFHVNYRIHRADGKIRWISEHGVGIPDRENGAKFLEGFIEDITNQKETENLLRVRNRALNSAGKGIIIADAQVHHFPIIYVNKAFQQITGYPENEVLGRNCNFLQGSDKHQAEIDIIRAALHGGKSCRVTLRNYRKDGSLFWNELAITPVKNEKRKLTHFIAVQNDITQQKREQVMKLHKQSVLEDIIKNEPLEMIVSQIVDILEKNIDGAIGAIWKFNEKKFQLELLSAPNFPKDLREALDGIPLKPDSCSCGKAAHFKQAIIVKNMFTDDSWKNYANYLSKHNLKSCWSYPLMDAMGQITGVLCAYLRNEAIPGKVENDLIKDTSQLAALAIEQNNIRGALLQSQAQLKQQVRNQTSELKSSIKKLEEANINLEDQITETSLALKRAETSETISSAIAKNFPKGVIILVNDDMEIVYMEGTAMSNIRMQKISQGKIRIDDLKNFSSRRKAIFKDYIEQTLKGLHLSFEIRYRGINYMVNTTPLSGKYSNNEIKHALLVLNDISEQKKAERDIRIALTKQKELNELKSRFIATASHEFRTPLSVILSSATLIERQNQLGQEEKRLRHTALIRSNVQNLVIILNDFLSLGKLEEGEIRATPEWFNLVDFTASLAQQLETNLKEGQSIEIIKPSEKIIAFLDPKLMRYILINLLDNAIKYSHENQVITIKIGYDAKKVSLSVIDQGIGIPREEHERMFQRFFRAKNSLNIKGTGLGLTIAKQYTELMGGIIHFSSEQGQGSIFTVEFPIPKTDGKKESIG
ncbi:PAS domain S-box protein [Flagellimonas meridianipacifica]|uniref:histidine kinase n=1 Tax=Flagellimonas meridianipacifica TaxID=1080225 RepID=A0A2T0MAX3_9FLAO|nr:PAS domain S-box protein [Allomuricauda pacifica]PRX54657.1 PAS domain S-box-containing protein [Allomuricauda pacifica]